jgi:glycosyltransferase involved in cell wall biosynthesis
MKILYVCNDAAYFDAHRRWLAIEAARQGHQVYVAVGGMQDDGRAQGPIDITLDVERHRFDPRRDALLAAAIRQAAARTQADVVHLITIKPVLFGSLGLVGLGAPRRVVCTFPGLGRAFDPAASSPKARLRRLLVVQGLKAGLAPSRVRAIFETESDRRTLCGLGALAPGKAFHIAGAGVDISVYKPAPLPPQPPLRLLFAARLLRAKGVQTVIEAARIVTRLGGNVEFVITGPSQPDDPDGLTSTEIAALAHEPGVSFRGETPAAAMPALLASVHGVILPTSYQEGVPRILIEAGAVGRLAIVSDNPGCTAFVRDGSTGVVLRRCDGASLAEAAIRLSAQPEVVESMAKQARQEVADGGYAEADVARQTLALYEG